MGGTVPADRHCGGANHTNEENAEVSGCREDVCLLLQFACMCLVLLFVLIFCFDWV